MMTMRTINTLVADQVLRNRTKTIGTCLVWTGYRNSAGYGWATIRQRNWLVHRFVWQCHFGQIPDGLCVLHRCDNPPCVNPEHLFLGAQADNVKDMIAKGRARNWGDPRSRRGERNHNAVFNRQTVIRMRAMRQYEKLTYGQISKIFGGSTQSVFNAVKKRTWACVQ